MSDARNDSTSGSVSVDLRTVTNTCFVIMPFRALFESQYERVVRPAVEAAGLACVRGNEIYAEQSIIQDIWRSIRRSRVIVAELSGRNPNVMYEIGLAHAIGKPIVLLTREQEDVPFDLRSLRYLYYDPNDPFWGDNLRRELTDVLQRVLETPSLAGHLSDVDVRGSLPDLPAAPPAELPAADDSPPIGGVWTGTWLSIKRERVHRAVLVIPEEAGAFLASMTVTYERQGQQTVVQETLNGIRNGRELSLTGVNYTYVERGNSRSYSLDSFQLTLSEDGSTLLGAAHLRHGTREVSFSRVDAGHEQQAGS